MCGRYTLHSSQDKLNQYYGTVSNIDLKPRYNISPSTYCPIVRLNNEKRELALCQWGLIPHWAKDTKFKPINAKAETVSSKPFFRSAFRNTRCLIPANGYYEWKTKSGKKQPYYIHPADEELFSFAGLWDVWEGPDKTIETFTIITTDANSKTAEIHNRMPVILAKADHDQWLAEGGVDLLRPCPDAMVDSYRVAMAVNKAGNEGAGLIDEG